jgi:uncharacterized protein (TIGR00288 family)
VQETKRIALLIDCDNVSHTAIEGVLEELAKHGTVNVRHAHGDWKSPSLSGWADKLHPHAIRPMQQFAYTKGKNATDSAMIIDAMDLLYSGNVDAFALMTSDSDFTPLVLRILESGFPVYGFGEEKRQSHLWIPVHPLFISRSLYRPGRTRPKKALPRLKRPKPGSGKTGHWSGCSEQRLIRQRMTMAGQIWARWPATFQTITVPFHRSTTATNELAI